MNIKINNEIQDSKEEGRELSKKKNVSSIKEERRRTGRYIAILVGISLFLLAMYHAWVRRIPIVASLVVPALIMFVYVAWVLYSASKDKHRLLDAETAFNMTETVENEANFHESSHNVENTTPSCNDVSKLNSMERYSARDYNDQSLINRECGLIRAENRFVTPIILINDMPVEDLDQKWTTLLQTLVNSDKFKTFSTKRKHKRKFCRRKHNVYKRSYSIA
ncbi:hypothetical protein ACJJTC_006610 [Scirpophaga incertulas]